MRIVVVGGGKVGYYLVKTLQEHGHEPVLIEQDRRTCRNVANELDIPIICGDGTTIEVLDNAYAQDADAIISVTGKDENNLIACQLAKKLFNVSKTVAKVNNPKNSEVMRQLGIDIVISSTENIVRLLEREVDTSAIKRLVTLNQGQSSISEVKLPEHYVFNGYRLSELKLPQQCVIISISRGSEIIIPRGNAVIYSGDRKSVV